MTVRSPSCPACLLPPSSSPAPVSVTHQTGTPRGQKDEWLCSALTQPLYLLGTCALPNGWVLRRENGESMSRSSQHLSACPRCGESPALCLCDPLGVPQSLSQIKLWVVGMNIQALPQVCQNHNRIFLLSVIFISNLHFLPSSRK